MIFYRFTGGFLYAFSGSKSKIVTVGSLKRVTGRIFIISKEQAITFYRINLTYCQLLGRTVGKDMKLLLPIGRCDFVP